MNCYKCATPVPDNARFCSACGTDVSGESHGHGETLAAESDPQLFAKLQAELGTDFVLERELGRGGMAVVYLGKDAHLNRKVAVKVLPPELTYGGGGSMIERFKREAQTAAKLDHPNVIPVFRVSTGGKLFWYVMKYLEGESLDHILEHEGQLPVETTVEIITQTAAALEYAHQNQVVHRDVKPANVIVDKKGWVTVTDFGIAKALDANTLTASGSMIGTPYYMSPEQCKGKRVGAAADQYSLAVMTYQMLGGHVPFSGDSAVEIAHKHVADPVPPLGVLRPELPAKVVEVVEKGLAKDAEDRFSSTAEFARALKAAAEGVDVQLAPPRKPASARMSKTALVSPVPGVMRTAKGSWKEKKGLWIGGWLVGFAVVSGVAVTLVLPRLSQQPAAAPAAVQSTTTTTVQLPAQNQPVTPVATAVASRMARIDVRGAPAGATITLDGRRMSGPRFQAEGGRQHTVRVSMPGFETWSAPVTPVPGEQMTVSVTLRPLAVASQVASAPPPSNQPAAQPSQPAAQPAANQPSAQPTAAPGPAPASTTGCLSVGTRPASTIYVNGTPRGSMLRNVSVPVGPVRLTFQVSDSTGIWWAQPREVTVAAGTTCAVLGFIPLVRP